MLKAPHKPFQDILDDEFIDIYKPIFYFLTIFGMRGVTIKDKFATPSNVLYKAYCITFSLVNISFVVYSLRFCTSRYSDINSDLPFKAGVVLNTSINTYTAIKNVFYNGFTTSQIYVKLQRIERVLKMRDAKNSNKILARTTAIVSVLFLLVLIVFIVFIDRTIEGFCPAAYGASAFNSMSHVQMLLVITIMNFLLHRARYLNEMLLQKEDLEKYKMYFKSSDWQPKERVSDEMLHGLYCILDSFFDFMDVFQPYILLCTVQLLVWQLILMQNIITSIKLQISVNTISIMIIMQSSVAYLMIMMIICLFAKKFTSTLEHTKRICTKYTLSCEGKSRTNAKLMILLLDGQRDATLYDIFTLDGQLLLHLFAITATYTIVLLQFAVL